MFISENYYATMLTFLTVNFPIKLKQGKSIKSFIFRRKCYLVSHFNSPFI